MCIRDRFELLVATYGLSEREAEIVREYSSGRSARYIADWFMLSEYTVKTHLRRSYVKMGICLLYTSTSPNFPISARMPPANLPKWASKRPKTWWRLAPNRRG